MAGRIEEQTANYRQTIATGGECRPWFAPDFPLQPVNLRIRNVRRVGNNQIELVINRHCGEQIRLNQTQSIRDVMSRRISLGDL